MKEFKWILGWTSEKLATNVGDVIPVYFQGRIIGNCTISTETTRIIGNFSLTEDLNNEDYVLYMQSVLMQESELSWLSGIVILPPEDSLKKRSKRVDEMKNP